MLLIMWNAGGNRYAIDSRHVSEVLPRVNLQPLAGSPSWLAGMLIFRGQAAPVMDLARLTGGAPCPNRFSTRILVLQLEQDATVRQFGVLAEEVNLREVRGDDRPLGEAAAGPANFGSLALDEQGVYQLVDVRLLASGDRQAILFPPAQRGP
ncbi:MAG: chemotaxis protein CheW [Thermoguttaceae bacterium]